ncbi:MAG: CHASE2 domain-containing protein, partial [Ghiorsea sp.]|nr:CHASE2 domain-containing protein [Ghiorsea sp.]
MKRAFWKTDWFLGSVLTLLFFAAYDSSIIKNLEFSVYDFALETSAQPANDSVVIIDIDDASIDLIGRWPWPRTEMADMIETLTKAQVRMVGVDIFYSEEQADNGNNAALKLADLLQEQGDALLAEADVLAAQGHEAEADAKFAKADAKLLQADKVIAEAMSKNGDARLVKAVQQAGNVFMPMFYEAGEAFGRPDSTLPPYISRMAIENIGDIDTTAPPISAVKLSYPFAELSQVSAGIGYLNVLRSSDGVLRSEPLIVDYYGKFFPSMSLAMVAYDLNLTMNDVLVNIGHSVELGALVIPTDTAMQVSPKFYADLGDKEGQAFRHISFYDLKA